MAGGGDDDVVVDGVVGEEVDGEAVGGGGDGVVQGGEGGGRCGGAGAGGGGGELVVAVGVEAAEGVDDVEAEVVAGAGVAAGELLAGFCGVLGVQGHGVVVVEDFVDVDEGDVVGAGPGEHVAYGGVGVGVAGGWRGVVGLADGGAVDVGPDGGGGVGVVAGGGGEVAGVAAGGVQGGAEPDAVDEVGDGGVGGEEGGAGGLGQCRWAGVRWWVETGPGWVARAAGVRSAGWGSGWVRLMARSRGAMWAGGRVSRLRWVRKGGGGGRVSRPNRSGPRRRVSSCS